MDDLTNRVIQRIFFDELWRINPWVDAREKSSAAEGRERTVTSKFDHLKSQMNMALIENTTVVLTLGCHSKSKSTLSLLSPDLVKHILSFVGMEQPVDADVATRRLGLAIVPFEGWRPPSRRRNEIEEVGIDLADMNLYRPGQKITIPLTTPTHHLTGPCYRDLRKHIKAHQGWDVQRIVATPQQKREYNEHNRKGSVYFINAIYKVQGRPAKRKRKRKNGFVS